MKPRKYLAPCETAIKWQAGINCFVRNVAFRFKGCGLWLRKPTGGMGEG